MTPRTPRNIGASVRARLLNLSRQTGEDYQFLLQRYVAERFLYRLGESEHRDNFVLKGAMLLALWGGGTYRPTRDLDFTAYGNSWKEHVRGVLQEICSIPAEDGIVFDNEEIRLESIRDQAAYNSFRAHLKATLAGAQITLRIDVGFGNAIHPSPIDSDYSVLLGHPPPRIRVYPREAFVAEKLHAMVVLGESNSRYKDFYDLYTLSNHFAFGGKPLLEAVVATFELRGTPISGEQPVALTPQFFVDADRAQEWRNYLDTNELKGAPANFGVVGEQLLAFLAEIWRALPQGAKFAGKWPAGGPWHCKPYPAYKDSGVEGLGEIPAHWNVNRLKTIAKVQLSNVDKKSVDGQADVQLCNYVDVYYNEKIRADRNFMAATATTEQIQRFSLSAGDVLITKDSETWTDIAVPAVVEEDLPNVLCGYHLAHIRPSQNCSGAFLGYAFAADGPRDQFQIEANGITRFGLGGDTIRCGVFPLPPLSEQRAIAKFLDRETEKIDTLVAKKEQLIALLKEKRAALITQAVTKGLDPDVPMKDSNIEWFGEIPAHWQVRKVTHLFAVGSGTTPPTDYPDYYDGEVPWITTSELRESIVVFTEKSVTKEAVRAFSALNVYPEGSVAVAMYGATIGRVGVFGKSAAVNQACCVFSESSEMDTWFWFYWLQFRRPYLISLGYGGGQPNLSQELLKSIRVPTPSPTEQRAIVVFLDRETQKIDALVEKAGVAIERLKELRAALISAAVTGKIDVQAALV